MTSRTFTAEHALALAELPLGCLDQEYPNSPGHLLNGPEDVKEPHVLHPAFFGCLDWHSSVHGHWLLVWLLKRFKLPNEEAVRSRLAHHLTSEKLQVEADYFLQPNRRSFERTYGWAWLLKLAAELKTWDDSVGQEWSRNMGPLEKVIVDGYIEFLPRQLCPIRSGLHSNTAFGLALAMDYAEMSTNAAASCGSVLGPLLRERAMFYFVPDAGYPAHLEPGPSDFLSPALMGADLMSRVLQAELFEAWLARFLPGLPGGKPETLLTPVVVNDRTDPQGAHLDGLNLSRAWNMRNIVSALPPGATRDVLSESAEVHADVALANVSTGDYMGEHWLASFAILLLSTY